MFSCVGSLHLRIGTDQRSLYMVVWRGREIDFFRGFRPRFRDLALSSLEVSTAINDKFRMKICEF